MSMKDVIAVNTHYTRSVNLERDAQSVDVIKAYIPTSRALRTFSRITASFHSEQAPRAWSLVGPYGSGKSSFSVFMSQLCSNNAEPATKEAQKILKAVEPDLAKAFAKQVKGNNGYLKVLVTGSPEPMAKRIVQALADAAESYWASLEGVRKDQIIKKLSDAAQQDDLKSSDILKLIKALQEKLQPTGCKGILLVIDELGKFLEYEARHYGANDIYLLQSLAEHACEGNEVNLMLFVLLHQSFEQYAKGLGESLKNEWSKVQGRFEEVPFLESAEQVLRVVSAAFQHNLDVKQQKLLTNYVEKAVNVLIEQEALPGAMTIEEANTLFTGCYPLHPMSAVLLPLLCQKVAQNERTLFSYLGSHEEFGLQDMLGRLESVEDTILPHHIFDYFITNQPAVMGDYITHRRWAEVVTAIERLGDSNVEEVALLKTIGILNIIGSKGGFKASKSLLSICFKNNYVFNKAAKTLKEKSVVNYRRFNSEYRVWQGSDFDLEAALQEETNNIGNFSLAEELNREADMQPIVARRYTIENGTLRYFVPMFVDAQTYKKEPVQDDHARIIFYLATGQDDEKAFRKTISKHFSGLDLTVLCLSGSQLREAVAETLALKRLRNSCQELNSDPVAKREFEDRLTAADQAQEKLLQNLTDQPVESEWWHSGEQQVIANKRALQVTLSTVLSSVYDQAPKIFNELINRDRPSSQAVAARNKLMYAMLNQEGVGDLAIEKFPPEKAIYRAVLRETDIHREEVLNELRFLEPVGEGADAANISPLWKRIDKFLDSTEQQAKSFAEMNQELMAPPYGVKAGLLPIFYMAVYMAYRHELAFYQNNRYLPAFDEELLDRFVKRPDEFTIQRFRIAGMNAEIYEQYQKALFSDTKQRSVVQLIKPLARFVGDLPKFSRKTVMGLSQEAIKLRKAFETSHSPEKLLFNELPTILGFDVEANENMQDFPERLQGCIRELKNVYPQMLQAQQNLLSEAFTVPKKLDLKGLRKHFAWYKTLESYTIEKDGLKAFINRLASGKGSDTEWLEGVLSFLGQLPTTQWTDSTFTAAEYKLSEFSKRILELQSLYIAHESHHKKNNEDVDVFMLRSMKLGGIPVEKVVTVDSKKHRAIQGVKEKLREVLEHEGLTDAALKTAVLAEFVEEYLTETEAEKAVARNSDTPKEVI